MKKFFLLTGICTLSILLYGSVDRFDPLPALTFSTQTSVLKGTVNDPLLYGDTLALFYGTVTGFRDAHCVVDQSGNFQFELSIGYVTEVRMGFASRIGERVSVFLTPGEESEVKIENHSSKLYYRYTGPLARVNEEFANRMLRVSLFPEVLKIDEVPTVTDIETFRSYLYDQYLRITKGIEERADLSPVTKRLLIMQRQIELYSFLKDAPYHLAHAGIFPDNGVITPQLPDHFFAPLSELPSLGDSRFLTCLQYTYLLDQMRATLPTMWDDSLHQGMYREGLITDTDYALLSRLTDLSNVTSVDQFTEEEKSRMYECLEQKELYRKRVEDRYWMEVFGADLRFVKEYWEALRYADKIRTFVPLSEQDIHSLKDDWSNDYFRQVILDFDRDMSLKKNRGAEEEVRRNDESGKVQDEDLFLSFYKPHKGSPALLMVWETWLDSESNVLKTFQPLKSELEKRGMKVVSIASDNSPEAEWKKMINGEYTGRHVRISRDQMRFLRNEYFIRNLPVFFLIDKEGIIVRRFTDVSLVRELLR